MPQLDQFTYLTQIVWLTGSFLGYYVIIYKYALPKLSRIFKLRARFQSGSFVPPMRVGDGQSVCGDNTLVCESMKVCGDYLRAQLSSAQLWTVNTFQWVNQLNADGGSGLTVCGANKTYIHSLAEMRLSQTVQSKTVEKCGALVHSSLDTPEKASKLRSIVLIRIRQYCGPKRVKGRTVSTRPQDLGVSVKKKVKRNKNAR